MSFGLSLYLDLIRFFMAIVVWTGHSTLHAYTGYPFKLWFMFPYMQTAVIAFFVLSGFVIAHVTSNAESSPQSYTIARISRLYSVVIPALILTFICDNIGLRIDPAFYDMKPIALSDHQFGRYIASFFMVNNFYVSPWGIPGTNGPFWTLSYEISYYIAFGLYLTRNKSALIVGGSALFIAAGFDIFALFPIWLLGVGTYHLQKRWTIPMSGAAILFPVSAVLLTKTGWARDGWDYGTGRPFQLDYADALLVAINMYAASSLSRWLTAALSWCGPFIRWLGSLTFVIYLCHRPLLQFMTVIHVDKPGTPAQQLWLFGGSFILMAAIGSFSDRLRKYLRIRLETLMHRLAFGDKKLPQMIE